MKLTQDEVYHLATVVTPRDPCKQPHIHVSGVFIEFDMLKEKLNEVKDAVRHMLAQLPEGLDCEDGLVVHQFHYRKDGKVWTHRMQFVEVLIALGRGTGLLEPTKPRSEWSGDDMASFRYVTPARPASE